MNRSVLDLVVFCGIECVLSASEDVVGSLFGKAINTTQIFFLRSERKLRAHLI